MYIYIYVKMIISMLCLRFTYEMGLVLAVGLQDSARNRAKLRACTFPNITPIEPLTARSITISYNCLSPKTLHLCSFVRITLVSSKG